MIDGLGFASLFFAIVALTGWLNQKLTHLPTAAAMVIAGTGCAALLMALHTAGLGSPAVDTILAGVREVNFQEAVLKYVLAFLLFAGAIEVDLRELLRRIAPIASLATLGVAVSTLLAGTGLWGAAQLLGLELPFAWALAFGALISPTDPIAVYATVQSNPFSQNLKSILLGEALFNDGVGIVVFGAAVSFAASNSSPDLLGVIGKVALEAAGGLVVGVIGGAGAVRAIRAIDDPAVEVTATLALAMGAYAIADGIGVSGPIAVVAAGLLMGEHGFKTAMSDTTRRYVRVFWTLVDQILNAALFLLLGLELAVAPPQLGYAGLALAAIVLVSGARLITILPWGLYFMARRAERRPSTVLLLGGVHGAISLALALSLPPGPARTLILSVTFAVVLVSVLVQGTLFPRFAPKLAPPAEAEGGD